jgi:hypothetical protein
MQKSPLTERGGGCATAKFCAGWNAILSARRLKVALANRIAGAADAVLSVGPR